MGEPPNCHELTIDQGLCFSKPRFTSSLVTDEYVFLNQFHPSLTCIRLIKNNDPINQHPFNKKVLQDQESVASVASWTLWLGNEAIGEGGVTPWTDLLKKIWCVIWWNSSLWRKSFNSPTGLVLLLKSCACSLLLQQILIMRKFFSRQRRQSIHSCCVCLFSVCFLDREWERVQVRWLLSSHHLPQRPLDNQCFHDPYWGLKFEVVWLHRWENDVCLCMCACVRARDRQSADLP